MATDNELRTHLARAAGFRVIEHAGTALLDERLSRLIAGVADECAKLVDPRAAAAIRAKFAEPPANGWGKPPEHPCRPAS
jgi:hypothetical protein